MSGLLRPITFATIMLTFAATVSVWWYGAPSYLEASVPEQRELIGMVAQHEGVHVEDIRLIERDTTGDTPYILYSVSKREPEVVYRALIHPRLNPWEWVLGGGSRTTAPEPGVAASLGLTSASGDTGTDVNTVIYGMTRENAAEVFVTVHGETHVRDVGDSGGFLILLTDQGVTPDDLDEIRVVDDQGEALPAPQHVS